MIQARHYTPTNGRQIDLAVLHDMEAPEKPTTAENIASWFAGPNAPRASAHWCHDSTSSVRCVADKDVAWHAPGVNHNALGHEQAGYARQSEQEWLDDYSAAMLRHQVAPQVRADCDRYGLPVRFVQPEGLLRGERGITIHRWVNEAFHRSSHWDTGFHFPYDTFLGWVRGAKGGPVQPAPIAGGREVLHRGSRGDAVRDWQRILIGAGKLPKGSDDGVFGPATEAATKAFQTQLGVTADGVVGPKTHEATARLLAWLAAQRPRPTVPPFPGTVRQGDRGPAVSAVQARLKARGWSITVDGVFGADTADVVRTFQAEKHLTVDGVAGPATWRALWTSPVT